ncbi:MAG TPA: sterol desaturase family protein [Chitinophagaceae bacterium]|nr:sterol desaturase family protein [Chitinophagaceae bacterium]
MHWKDYFFFVENIGTRYFLLAALAFIVFYFLLRKRIAYKKIQPRFPRRKDYFREIAYSVCTIAIFGAVPMLLVKNQAVVIHTRYYRDIATYGWLYFFAAFPLLLIIHDTYFYWTHRLMHHKKLFRVFHLVHHHSTNPSPWAAYAFHPLEAVVEAGVFAVFLFAIPVHPLHFYIFFFFMIVYNVYGHLGYELYPRGFSRHWLGKWINTSVSHNQHHQFFKGNYGLYFTFWDRLMGTMRKDYEQQFEAVKARKQ